MTPDNADLRDTLVKTHKASVNYCLNVALSLGLNILINTWDAVTTKHDRDEALKGLTYDGKARNFKARLSVRRAKK